MVLEVRYVLFALVIAWVIAIGAGCFTTRLLIGRSAAESDSYGIYVLLSAVVATAAIVTAVFLSITSVSRTRRGMELENPIRMGITRLARFPVGTPFSALASYS